jgi:hypothetical protein
MQVTNNARFWIFSLNGGWVKLTLKPGQRLSYCRHQRTDEGFIFEAEAYEFDAEEGIIIGDCHIHGRDCDGPHEANVKSYCPFSNLRVKNMAELYPENPENIGIYAPIWEHGEYRQRDEFAKAAGY